MDERELRGSALRERILALPAADRNAWVDDLFGITDAPPDAALPRGSVPYLPCGVGEILAAVEDVPLRADDMFVDLGSGLGRVVLLAHLLSGACGLGVEIQPSLVTRARAQASALGLAGVSFVEANAADLDLDGSVFFMYAPFNGRMLTSVLERVEAVARRHAVVLCTVDVVLPDLAWLTPRRARTSIAVYDSCVPGVPPRE